MPDKIIKPTILVFAGPNGSGKSTITKYVEVVPPYINADDVKKSNQCSDLDAAIKAEELREKSRIFLWRKSILELGRNKKAYRNRESCIKRVELISTKISTNYLPYII